jgi:hypothetical protein
MVATMIIGYALVAVLAGLAVCCLVYFFWCTGENGKELRPEDHNAEGALLGVFIFGMMAFTMATLTEALGQEIETPWVRVDTGSDWLDLLFVAMILVVIAALYLIVQGIRHRYRR